jgi:hypothetical protein
MALHGLTVTSGTTPDTFQGTVLGVLQDGIAPGLDMIMVKLNGSQITDANGNVDKGVWAGMSGSPLYTATGDLVGAVSYGLSLAPSDVAGVTPAAEMLKLVNGSAATRVTKTAAHTTKVALGATTARRLVRQGAITSAQAASGFKRLPMPFSVSGLSRAHLRKVAHRLNIKQPMVVGSSASAAAAATPIVPGGNLAASLSYGDVTDAGIGTATAVCGDSVLAFGHPMLWSGRSTLSMHGADAIYIQRDTTFGSFKVANITAPVGRLTGDRMAGIAGVINSFPRHTDVTSHVVAANGNRRHGETVITWRPEMPFLSSLHLLSNADRVIDQFGAGTATVRWTFTGTRAHGAQWTYTRKDRFADHYDITFASIWDSYRQMSQILNNRFEHVRITNVHYNASYSSKFQALQIRKLEIKPGAHWITITGQRHAKPVSAGTTLPVRVTLTPSSGHSAPVVERLAVRIPRSARGGEGLLTVQGGGPGSRSRTTSFDELLTNLARAPRNDSVTATLETRSKSGGSRDSDSSVVSEVVSGHQRVWLNVR